MAEERPATAEEIQILREHVNLHITENGSDLFHPKDVERFMKQDDYVSRFFMHCTDMPNDHIKNTVEMVIRSFKYRLERNIRDLTSNDLGEDLKAKGSLYLRNRDKDGKQLLIFDVKKHVKGVVPMEEMQKVFLYFLERIDRESEDGMVTIVFDCQGCGLKNMDMEFIRYMIDVLKDYFPQVLNYILVLDMPWVLNAAWKIIKAWLPAAGVRKIKFVNKNTVDEYVIPDQKPVAWGGNDTWEYEFVEEQVLENGHNNESISSEEDIVAEADSNEQPTQQSATVVDNERKISLNTLPTVFHSIDQDSPPGDFDISPKDELVFLKGPKGLMATISLTKNAPTNMAFKIKTTTPERYRVRPSIGLIEDNSTLKIEVYYQPVNPESDDNTDILKDKFLVMLFFDVSLSEWRNQVKERKPSKQHRMRASIKKSTLKATETRKEGTLPGLNPVDKDKDVYLKALKSLEAKHELLQEDSKKILFYLQAILVAFLSIAFMTTLIWYSFKEQHDNSACNCMSTTTENTFQFEKPSDHRPSFEQEL